MPAGTYNITIDQGSDFAIQLTLSEDGAPKDLTDYSARAQMRKLKSSDTVSATFTCTIINASEGALKMELSNSATVGLSAGIYYYDLELFTNNDGNVTRLLEGQVNLTQEVTR